MRLEYRDSRIVIYDFPVSAILEAVASGVYDVLRASLGLHAFSFRGGAP